jgi:23S rRNA pseudouridine1911/1915/1917 synthase
VSTQRFRLDIQVPGGRLDRLLAEREPAISRTRWQQTIRQGGVTVDGNVIDKPSFVLAGGERVEAVVLRSQPTDLQPESIPLQIVYEDDNLLVVDKPAGMVVHPSAGHVTGTLVHAALAHAPGLEGVGGERRPGIVHRLDKGTSGLILLAKNDPTHAWLQSQFSRRLVDKEYLALVDGRPPTAQGLVDAPIGRDPSHRKRMAVVRDGRPAETRYRTLELFPDHTLLEIHPKTGRTHQIRIHLAFLKCPVVADRVYGRRRPSLPLERPFLHAHRLTIALKEGEPSQTFVAPLPPDLELVLEEVRTRAKTRS